MKNYRNNFRPVKSDLEALNRLNFLRWSPVALILVTGIINLYYGNSFAGFYENLWYVMGGIYIFAAVVIAANIEPRFSQLTVFAYTLFLWSVWATVALETGTGLDAVADRKSTRLNSSHLVISYAVFCL